MTPIHELENMRSRRAELVTQMRAILTTAREETRGLNAEETQEYDRMETDLGALNTDIRREEGLRAEEEGLERQSGASRGIRNQPEAEAEDEVPANVLALFEGPEYEAAYREYLARGATNMSPENRALLENVRREAASYNLTTPGEGGYTVPETWRAELVEHRTQFGILRQLGTVIVTASGEPLHIPTVIDGQTADDLDEEDAYTESEDTFSEVVLNAYKKGVLVKISEELLNDSLFDMSSFITRRAGRSLALKEGPLFAKGAGGGNVTGITVAAAVGKTTAAAAAVTADEVLDFVHSVSPPYRSSAQIVMHDSTLLAIAKLVDDNLNYLWQPGLRLGDPDRVRGYAVYIDPFYDTIAAAKVIATFGDHAEYYIREAGPTISQRLNELYAGNGQVGFRFAERIDANLVDTAAVKSLKTHA